MPVWLDAIPEKAPKIARPNTRRWLLFLAFIMLGGIALTLWCWTSERTGFVFWFTALGLPFCTWGLLFGLRRFAYKAGQVGAESRNVEREALIDSEILRGQRCAWILGTYIQSPTGNKADDLLEAMEVAAPAIDFSHPRGCDKPVRYAALPEYQADLTKALKGAVNKLTTRVEGIVQPLLPALPCWLVLDCDNDLYPLIEEQLKADLLLMVVLSNRNPHAWPDALRLHRPERGTETTLTKTLTRALLWAKTRPNELKGSWISGPTLMSGSGWNNACEENGVTFSLSEDNFSIDPVLGYTGHAAPWLAITLADAAFEQRGAQVIAAQPTTDKDDVWFAVITKELVR